MDVLVIVGIMGEFFMFLIEEKLVLFCYLVKVVDGCVFVVVGIGSNNMYVLIELMKKVEEIGVDVIMIVVFYYNKLN